MRVGPSVNALVQVAYAISILANMIERDSKNAVKKKAVKLILARGATSNTATHSGVRTNDYRLGHVRE